MAGDLGNKSELETSVLPVESRQFTLARFTLLPLMVI